MRDRSDSSRLLLATAAVAALGLLLIEGTALSPASAQGRASGQTPAPQERTPAAQRPTFDAFEVASIRPTAPDWRGGRFIRMQGAHQFVARNHALRTLIAAAYNLTPQAVSGGPTWVDSSHYDILAETPGDVPPNYDEQMSMLRRLLADRFKLTFHREPREFSIYALTVAKNGSKLKESTVSPDELPQGPPPLIFVVSPQSVHLPGRDASMGELASVFQRSALDRPVIDQTGLPGRYDFDLEFTPDETVFGGALGKGGNADDSVKPGLFTALQDQLGLKLESTRGPVDVLVIDHIEEPSPN
jgi:uncharacterized protein (TIGR03435 family)